MAVSAHRRSWERREACVNAVEPIIPKHMQDFLDAWRTAEAEGYECVIYNEYPCDFL